MKPRRTNPSEYLPTAADYLAKAVCPFLIMTLVGTDNIRDVIAFPKASSGGDPLMSAPSEVDAAQLAELGLALRPS